MIRQANEADIDVIADFLYKMATELEAMGEFKMVSQSIAKKTLKKTIADEIGDPKYCFVLAKSGGNDSIIGCGVADIINLGPLWKADKILHINDVYVEPDHRRQGIGKNITKSLLKWGAERGCKHCELNVLVNNHAVDFYKSLGFNTFRHQMTLSI